MKEEEEEEDLKTALMLYNYRVDHCTHVTQLHNQSLCPCYTVTQPITTPMLHSYTTNHCTRVAKLHNQSQYKECADLAWHDFRKDKGLTFIWSLCELIVILVMRPNLNYSRGKVPKNQSEQN